MGTGSLTSPLVEDHKSTLSRKSISSSTKSVKPMHRPSKRASSSAATIHRHDHIPHKTGMDGRNKRVWKACERCRMKKTKCDGEFPCRRCKDDSLVCTAGVRKKTKNKQVPSSYAEVLENTQYALITTVHELYSMVRNNQSWDLGEPELDDRGQPVIHNIVQKLGCICLNRDVDLPVHSVFPKDEARTAKLVREHNDRRKKYKPQTEIIKDANSSACNRTEGASSSELNHSDIEHDYRKAGVCNTDALTLLPQGFTGSVDCDFAPQPPVIGASTLFPSRAPAMSNFPAWSIAQPQHSDLTIQFLQRRNDMMTNMDLLNQGHGNQNSAP
ncbi:hypothetical protein QL093DRAFT_2101601 [Fusarium oxysporum]|nr:hypothetical protein QL093DRAFT_2101601 [Fusarium oxysporum]